MTDICFIYLPHPYLKRPDAQLPMGILMLAAITREKYVTEVKNYASYTINRAIWELPEAKVYGITITSMEIPDLEIMSRLIRAKYPESIIMVGGPGTTVVGLLDECNVDVIVDGEADEMILDIMEDIDKDFYQAVYSSTPPQDLDALPFPARDLIEGIGGDVFAYNKNYIGEGSTVILSSRGCPHRCAYCVAPNGVRYRSPASVVGEMESVIKDYGIHQFRFSDDMFTSSRKRVFELCELIGPLGIAWRISIRVKPMDKEMLRAMAQAGLKEISFGCESFDNDVLVLLNKGAKEIDNYDALEMAAEVGIDARVLLMIGTPGQTPKTIWKNKYAVNDVPHKIVACTTFVPMPGSDVWYNPDKYGIEILSKDMRDYNFYFFGPDGVNNLKPVIRLKDRPLDEFLAETSDFRQWLFEREDINRG